MTRLIAVATSLFLVVSAVPGLEAATQLTVTQLENLVAPVALYPDP